MTIYSSMLANALQRGPDGRFRPGRPSLTVEDRFWAKVDTSDESGCWSWIAARGPAGYGRFRVAKNHLMQAHRYAYELLVGCIPVGLQLDHLCRNPACVNPSHLEPVTNRENGLRGVSDPAQNARKTFCKRGHPLTPPHLYVQSNGWRRCMTCQRDTRRLRDNVQRPRA